MLPAQNLKESSALWSGSSVPLCPLIVIADGAIEDLGQEFLQVFTVLVCSSTSHCFKESLSNLFLYHFILVSTLHMLVVVLSGGNVKALTKELLEYLKISDPEFKVDLFQDCHSCAKANVMMPSTTFLYSKIHFLNTCSHQKSSVVSQATKFT